MNKEFYGTSVFSPGMKLIHACCIVSIPVLLSSCDIINPAEPVPSYIHVDSFSLSTNALTQGSSSHKIVDAWASVDGTVIGTFELPATFPVLSTGTHTLTLRPGIMINGIAATRTVYPFYNRFETTIALESGQIKTVTPTVNYFSSARFKIEDFDQSGRSMIKVAGSDTDLVIIQNEHSFEANSGAVYLDDAHSYFQCAWKDSFPLPTGGPAYVELNYKCDNPFVVGLRTITSQATYSEDIVGFKATQTWKKVYVSLGPALSNITNVLGFKVYLKATKDANISSASLYFDNIKVVY